MADRNSIALIRLGEQVFDLSPWGIIGTDREYYLTLLSRDDYAPVLAKKPTENDLTYTDPASDGLAVFHAGQCAVYPDDEVSDGLGLSIAKKIETDTQGKPIKVYWVHVTDMEKRIKRLEDGVGLWHNGTKTNA